MHTLSSWDRRFSAWLACAAAAACAQTVATPGAVQIPHASEPVSSGEPPAARPDAPLDTDRDGVPDPDDFCVAEPEDRDRCYDDDGCADPDNDADGTPDEADRCPIEYGPAHNAGCRLPPKPGWVVVEASDEKCMILHPVEFETDRDRLTPDARLVVERNAECMKEHPQVLLIEVRGHSGPGEMSIDLTYRRARTVRDALVAHGVDGRRLRAVAGTGQTDHTDNRQSVIFIIVKTMACPDHDD